MIVYRAPSTHDQDLGIYQSPYLCGVDLVVNWNEVQPGSTTQNWGQTSDTASPEIAAWEKVLGDTGSASVRTVNLIVVGASETRQDATPGWVTSDPIQSTVTCRDHPTPVMWDLPYQSGWERFIQKTLAHFNGQPDIGYIRFGLGTGGEGIIDRTDVSGCQAQWSADGYPAAFANYVDGNPRSYETGCPGAGGSGGLIGYIASQRAHLTSPPDVQVSLNADEVPCESTVAAEATVQHLGFGNQALSMRGYDNNCGSPPSAWCAQFKLDSGRAPLHLQTIQQTCNSPNPKYDKPGDLGTLLTDAQNSKAQMLEIYQSDWEAAFTKTSSCYGTYPGFLKDASQSYFGEA